METPPLFTAFATGFTLSLSLIMAIGAQNTFVLHQGLRREHVAVVVLACTLLDVVLMTVGVSGLAVMLGEAPRLRDALGLLGALALAVYGLMALKRAFSPHALRAAADGTPASATRVLAQVLSISLLNPHVYLDTVVLVGAVGAKQAAGLQPIFLLGASVGSAAWFAALGYGARLLTPLFARPAAWRILDGLVAVMMGTIAYGLARESLHF